MSKKRDWFKWKLRAGTRGTIRRTSRRTGNGFEVMGACVAMLDHARGASHHRDNPEGVFTTTIADLAHDYTTAEGRVREVLGALVATGWLNTSGDVAAVDADADLSVRVVRYLVFNDPQGSDADRKAAQRERESMEENALLYRRLLLNDTDISGFAEVLDLRGSVTTGHNMSAMSPEEKRREEKKTPLSDKPAAAPDRDKIQNVFDYWVRVESETGGIGSAGRGRKPKLTKERAAKIRSRLAEDYTVADLKMAIAFYAKDPHHSGDNDRGTRFTDLLTTLKNGAKVEAGIAGYEAKRNPNAGLAVDYSKLGAAS